MGSNVSRAKNTYDVQGATFKAISEDNNCSSTVDPPKESNMSEELIKEHVLCDENELENNEMKEFAVEDGRVLLVKEDGVFSALGAKCCHYGAPLSKGVLSNGVVRCPWHGACFNSKTGDIEDFPGMDSLAKYNVTVANGKVKLQVTKGELQNGVRQKPMCKRDLNNNSHYVIIGAGASAASCAETLRQEGFSGKIIMVTKEMHLPYDRVKLSKTLDLSVDKISLRNTDFYTKYGIELMHNKEVVGVSTKAKILTFKDNLTMRYDKLMIATGGIPRRLELPGSHLDNVVVLRSVNDANYISKHSADKNIVILGLSFIGMETAASLVSKAASVTVVGSPSLPFVSVLGEKIAIRLRKFFEDKGVKFSDALTIKEFIGDRGRVKEVLLGDDTKIPADLCLLGIGVNPATGFCQSTNIEMSPEGYIIVNKCMKSNVNDVYAAGDITKFPLFINGNQPSNVQHWQMALSQGKVNFFVPFFWTMFFGVGLRYCGYGVGFDGVVIDGNVDAMEFVAFYIKGDTVVAIATMKRDPVAAKFAEILRSGKTLTRDDVCGDGTCKWFP
uniref:Rieske domain-containing protein n=1 Tax=Strigamia maritima TaxID=126957 RepID=T1J5D3_STRMM